MQKIEDIKKEIEHLDVASLLSFVSNKFKGKAAFSTSLGWEDQVITHHIFTQNLPIKVFTLDTGRLFPETYSVMNSTRERYHKNIEVFFPKNEAVEKLLSEKGPISFYESVENRKECCFIRKVESLQRALKGIDCWITGLRSEQSDNRENIPIIEWDEKYKLYKVHPLINWKLKEVKDEIAKYNIPYNVLHDRGFPSIGCAPCTRAVKEGDDFRSGRWWWEDNSKKECGIHVK